VRVCSVCREPVGDTSQIVGNPEITHGACAMEKAKTLEQSSDPEVQLFYQRIYEAACETRARQIAE